MTDDDVRALYVLYPPVFGGPHNEIAVMDGWLRQHGVHTTALLPSEGVAASDRLRAAGVEVTNIPLHRMRASANLGTQWSWVRAFNKEVEDIVTVIRQRQIDVVVTSSLPNLQAGFAAKRAGVPCVWKLVDSFPPPLARRAYMPVVLSKADVIMTTGVRIAEQHRGVTSLGDRWFTYYPSVDVDRFRRSDSGRAAARAELGLSIDDLVIGNVANLNPMKGHKHFIRAAAELRVTHPDARFVILGQQYPHFAEYCAAMWEEAERLGLRIGTDLVVRDPRRAVHELAQAFDIFWMTSEPRSEGIPTVIGEAKALGLPVVATDVGSAAEAVTNDVSGYVVPARFPDQIARATRRLLASPTLMLQMSNAARAEAEMQFAHARSAATHAAAYRRAILHRAEVRT